MLLPLNPTQIHAQREFNSIIDDYNATALNSTVSLIRRGEDFSSLRELMAMNLAGESPDIAIVESAEVPTAVASHVAQPLPEVLSTLTAVRTAQSLPFLRVRPLLFANLEKLTPLGLRKKTIAKWSDLTDILQKLKLATAPLPQSLPAPWVALPLQGQRGLWLFEALTRKPLWKREEGGIRSNRALKESIAALQLLIDQPPFSRPEETWERAVQSFVDRTSFWLLGSSDLIPYLNEHATFEWLAAPLPQLGSSSELVSGSDLIILKVSPEVIQFLQYLYSPAVASRWTSSYGALPLKKTWFPYSSPQWRNLLRPVTAQAARTTDKDVVRTRSVWVQSLHLLFGETSHRPPIDDVFISLDRSLSAP